MPRADFGDKLLFLRPLIYEPLRSFVPIPPTKLYANLFATIFSFVGRVLPFDRRSEKGEIQSRGRNMDLLKPAVRFFCFIDFLSSLFPFRLLRA